MECVVYMGTEDTIRQALNVYRMRLLGAEVIPVQTGTGTLKDAVSAAMREWTNRITDTHYCLGSVMGPHPFPTIVRDFQSVISQEIREQILQKEGRLPDAVLACVGGGSNAIGAFYHFIGDKNVRLIGCEAAGRGRLHRSTPFPQGWTIRELVRSTHGCMTSGVLNTSRLPTTKLLTLLSTCRAWKALFRRSRVRMP